MEEMMDKIVDVAGLFNWLVYGGGVLIVASWVLDKIPAFVVLPTETKKLLNMTTSVFLALASYAVIVYVPAEAFAMIDPWFKITLGVVLMYSGQQIYHKLTK
jgi:hypothetical protein